MNKKANNLLMPPFRHEMENKAVKKHERSRNGSMTWRNNTISTIHKSSKKP